MKKALLTICVIWLLGLPVLAQDMNDLDLLLDAYVTEDDPAVVVFIDYAGETWRSARGLADYENEIPAEMDDLFRIASVTKPFVATLILQLVEAGEIDLDAPIADYLPDEIVNNVDNADTATVRQILQMTSGIVDYLGLDSFNDAVEDNLSYAWSAEETIEFIYDEPADFPAGTDYEYSNSNYNLAQIIIEGVTGKSLAELLDAQIFEPLGMAGCYLETPDVFGLYTVRGYEVDSGEWLDVTDINDGVGLGDGGIVCPAEDLAKFPTGLLNDLLEEDSLEAMFDTVEDGDGGEYGLGIAYEDSEYGEIISHDGAASGFQSMLVYLVDENLTVVILTNDFYSDIVEDLAYNLIDSVLDE